MKNASRLALAYDVLLKGIKAYPAELLSTSLKEVLEPDYKNKILYKLKNTDTPSRLEMLLNLCSELLQDNEKLSTVPDIKLVESVTKSQKAPNIGSLRKSLHLYPWCGKIKVTSQYYHTGRGVKFAYSTGTTTMKVHTLPLYEVDLSLKHII